jgi:hypothetical protein
MLFVLSTAFGVFGSNPISDYLRAVIAYLPLVFVAIVIVVIAAAIAAGARNLIGIKTMARRWEAVAARYDEEKPRIAGPCAALLPCPAKPVRILVPSPGPTESGRKSAATDPGGSPPMPTTPWAGAPAAG